MPANSLPRRLVKMALARILPDAAYTHLQAVAMAHDIKTREWWEPEIELVGHVLRPGETALDIGGNFGLWAYHMAKAVGPTGKVFSFEPVPFTARTFRLVSRRLSFGPSVQLIERGCAEQAGTVEFTIPVDNTGAISAGVVHMGRNDARVGKEKHANFHATKPLKCQVVRIDDELPHLNRLTMLKCDVEGADLFAMRGTRRTLEEHKPLVVIEITPWFLEGFGLKVSDVTGFFGDLGYECFHYEDEGYLKAVTVDDIVEDNWVFVHPQNRERVADLIR